MPATTAPTAATAVLPTTATHPATTPANCVVLTGQILSTVLPVHRDLVVAERNHHPQAVAVQRTHAQAPALLCPDRPTRDARAAAPTRDARADRTLNPEPAR